MVFFRFFSKIYLQYFKNTEYMVKNIEYMVKNTEFYYYSMQFVIDIFDLSIVILLRIYYNWVVSGEKWRNGEKAGCYLQKGGGENVHGRVSTYHRCKG